MTTSGGTLTVAGPGIQHVTGGTECSAAESNWQTKNGNQNTLEGCAVSETMTFQKQ